MNIEIKKDGKKVVVKQKKFKHILNMIEPDFSSIRNINGNKLVFEMMFQNLKLENRQLNG